VNRADRAPLLLIVAGALLLLAVVAYLINDAQGNSQWREAALRGQQALHAQAQHSIVEMKTLEQERTQSSRDRAELHDQNEAILKSLARIQRLLEEMDAPGPAR
jgi:type II secretory pathway component PulM